MLNADAAAPAASAEARPAEPATTSLVELDDEEILAWLTASILDDPEPLEPARAEAAQDFWERVAAAQAAFEAQGIEGPAGLERAIGLVGLELSLGPGASAGENVDAAFATSLGEQELVALASEILERAGRAVAVWASLQGSALRAASHAKG